MARESQISDWIQIVASLGVLVGLLLVVVEIRESNRVATSESVGAMNQAWMDYYLVGAESRITGILKKSYEDPNNLSTEEMMRLVHWYDSIINLYTWHLRAYELGTAEIDPVPIFAFDAEYQFGSPPEFVEAADVALEHKEPDQIPPIVVLIRDIMQRQKEANARK